MIYFLMFCFLPGFLIVKVLGEMSGNIFDDGKVWEVITWILIGLAGLLAVCGGN